MSENTLHLEPPVFAVRLKLVVLATIAILSGAVVLLWLRLESPPAVAAAVGDATAPFVGILTAAALGAAIWSVHLQRHAITVQLEELQAQRLEMAASRQALEDQTTAQNELATYQRKQLRDAELRELRSAYAHWFAEIRDWLTRLTRGPGPTLEAFNESFRRVDTSMWQVVLLDVSSARVVKVRQLSSQIGSSNEATHDDQHRMSAAKTAVTRLEELDQFKQRVMNWFQTGSEDSI